jgi:hypothetical protein
MPRTGVRIPGWERKERYLAYRQHREWCTRGGERPLYNQAIAEGWLAAHPSPQVQDGVALYRHLLSRQPDRSVTICAIGTLSALAQLLDSPPDAASPLSGLALVAQKVERLVTMAGAEFPEGEDTFNWRMDLPAAVQVVERWPTPLVASSLGTSVYTGARFMAAAPPDHPVAVAYRTFLGDSRANRPSWDLLAVWYAVCQPAGALAARCGFTLQLVAQSGRHRWIPGSSPPDRCYLVPLLDDLQLARRVEDLMIASLCPGDWSS